VLRAASSVFASHGFDGASMSRIAEASSTAQPLLHYHFGSKEDLWKACVEFQFAGLRRTMDAIGEATRDLDAAGALRVMLRAYLGFTAEHPEHSAIILAEARANSARFAWMVEHWLAPLHARMDRVIDAAAADGAIRPIPPANFMVMLIGGATMFFGAPAVLDRLYGVDVHDPTVQARHADWMIEMLLGGLGGAGADTAAGSPSTKISKTTSTKASARTSGRPGAATRRIPR
jgi:TetR/AcrR family transcriptional regulator